MIRDFLQASLAERSNVTIYFQSGEISGNVTRLESDEVEIQRNERRIAIRISSIDAVSME